MKLSKRSVVLSGYILGAASLLGCTVQAGVSPTSSPPPPRDVTGSVTVRWTIADTVSPAQCAYYRVDALSLVIYDANGATVTRVNAPCEHFSVTVDLYPGTYAGDARMVDVNNAPRSLTLPLDNIRVTSGTDLAIGVDFPARSFL